MRTSLLSSYPVLTFGDYFKLNFAIEEVVAYFGYTFQSRMLTLPHSSQPIVWYEDLYTRLTTSLPFGLLERTTKGVTQDLNLYRVPADLKELLQILVAILTENSETRP